MAVSYDEVFVSFEVKRKKGGIIQCRNQVIKQLIFFKIFISNKNEKNQILINKPVYFDVSLLEGSKIVMDEFLYDYVKLEFGAKAKL